MQSDHDRRKARIEQALAELAPLDGLLDLLTDYRNATIRWATKQRTDDLCDVFTSQDEIYCILERAFALDLTDQRADLASECLSECDYDIGEGSFLNDAGVENFGSSHPDSGRGFRL